MVELYLHIKFTYTLKYFLSYMLFQAQVTLNQEKVQLKRTLGLVGASSLVIGMIIGKPLCALLHRSVIKIIRWVMSYLTCHKHLFTIVLYDLSHLSTFYYLASQKQSSTFFSAIENKTETSFQKKKKNLYKLHISKQQKTSHKKAAEASLLWKYVCQCVYCVIGGTG